MAEPPTPASRPGFARPAGGRKWIPYRELHPEAAAISGDLRVLPRVGSPQLGNARDLLAWLPGGAESSGRRYPVVYMHDGQNLFDAAVSFAGAWRVDATMTALAAEGIEALVVGVPNTADRLAEYTPYPGPEARFPGEPLGRGRDYLRFLVETVKPLVEATLPADPDPATNGLAGSSLGGLISLYGFFARPDVFGFAAAMSPGILDSQLPVVDLITRRRQPPGRLYLDVGGREGSLDEDPIRGEDLSLQYWDGIHRLAQLFERIGYRPGTSFLFVAEPDDPHHESAWGRRLAAALRFLLGPVAGPAAAG